MNKKGFTLVELLGVIILIAAILGVIYPAVNSVINKGKDTVSNIQIKKILNGAYDYSLEKLSLLPSGSDVTYITLNELKKYGYVDTNIINSDTNELFPNDMVISIKKVGTNYTNKIENVIINGSYLYKIEEEKSTNKPEITFPGGSEYLSLNVGESYSGDSCTAKDYNNNDLTNKIVTNITKDDKNINIVDTHDVGIYKINCCVVDLEGNASCNVLSVVVRDNEVPELIIPENADIDTTVTSYDLMNGVSCVDNSGKCNIDIEGTINYGIVGEYSIKYEASDPSGNTVTKKRVIKVK